MKEVNTTLGPIRLDKLGKVNVHDHVVIDRTNNERIPEDFHHTDVVLIGSDLLVWKAAGGGAIVDSSPIGAGRNIQMLVEVSQVSQVPIIVTTGFHKLSYYPADHWLFSASMDELVEILSMECTEGVLIDQDHPFTSNRSSVKANMVKVGMDSNGLTPVIRNMIDAAAIVMNELGIPCMIHTEPGVPFEEVIEYLDQVSVPPSKVMVCHMGKSLDSRLYETLAGKGFFLEFDEMIRPLPPLDILARSLKDLFDQGYGASVLFAGDFARRSYWTCYGGSPGLAYLVTELDERLTALGLTREMLDQVWLENSRRFFA
jgi:5-phospho-D-xylono-1,4-lactonase